MDKYVIITPARDEEAFIEKTIQSIINQTIQPVKWIIVNDNSTDKTGAIVERYAAHNSFIQLISLKQSAERHFGSKVRAFNRGVNETQTLEYQYIGNVDADISLEKDHFERLLGAFAEDSNLGIAGGMVSTNINGQFVSQNVALDSVAGAVQFFRRECFEQIGGYLPLPMGGIDAAAEIMARMKGWKVRTFPGLSVREHRRTGTAKATVLRARLREGRRFYSLGYNWWFFGLRCLYRSMEQPRLIGSGATIVGFALGVLRQEPVVLGPDVVRFLRTEQRLKLLRKLHLLR
jgi:glycosyltransferase involved in cell wall biosynthesis